MSPPDGKGAPEGRAPTVPTTGLAAPGASPALPPGTRIHQYEIIRILGQGGMGTVFLARDLKLGRRVAIKLLQTDQPEQAQRLLAEARATARCHHDNIVVIHEVGEHAGVPYLVLEHLDGQPLAALLDDSQRQRQRLPHARAVEIACAIARALARAHDAGIVHRDLKPDNVFITESGTIKVLDFGIAISDEPARERAPDGPIKGSIDGSIDGPIDGPVAGTLPYMAPEQWGIGLPVNRRADLWALGILLHRMICGRHPLPTSRLITTAALDVPMPSLAEAAPPGVPPALIEVVDRCLRKRPDERWQTAADLAAALAPFQPGRAAIELPLDESPYAGLAAFQERDAAKFFGRGGEIAALATRLRDRPLVAVVGSSGVGKSSFVRAGVIPALKRSGEPWEALIARPGLRPIEALAAMLHPIVATSADLADELAAQQALADRLRREPGHLGDVLRLHARRHARRVLVFVDQLEELYTQAGDGDERAAFTTCLAAAADDATSPLRVALSIRSDFLDRLAGEPQLAGGLGPGLFFLGPPGRDGLRDAITHPAERAGFAFEPAIVDDMLDHLAAAPGALPLLQFTAARLWEVRDRARRLLAHESYAALGGVAGALASHADRVVGELGPERASLVRALLLRLVTAERTRAIVPLAELRALSRDEGEVQRLIDQLVGARLLVVQTAEGAGATVELVHESLVHGWPTLRRWLDEHQDDAALVDQLRTAARQWDAKGRDPGLLWRGDALGEYERWRKRNAARLTPVEAAFGAASVAAAVRGRRIRRAIAAAALAIAAVFFAALWRANLAANGARRDAEGLLRDSYLEQGRLRVLDGDKLGALAPLAAAYRMGSTGAATRLLLEEAARPTRARLRTIDGHTDKLWDLAYSPDGKWLATASADGTARVWDAASGAPRATIRHDDRVISVAFSPDSRLVASGGADRTVHVWDVIAGREALALPSASGARQIAFSPDGALLLVAAPQRVVKLWRMPSGTPAGELGGHAYLQGATFCKDASCIVTWDPEKVVVWDAATLAQRASSPQPGRVGAVAVSRTGSLIAIGTRSGELVLLHGDGGVIGRRAAHDDMIYDVAISPDETLVATCSTDLTARLWSAAGEPRGVLAGHRARVTRVRFTPDGERLVTTSADNTARLWSASGMLLGELTGHTNLIMMAGIRPDGAALATASWDHTAMIWDLAAAQEIRPIISAHDPTLPVVAFEPGGGRLAVARGDGSLAITDVQTGALTCAAPAGAAISQLAWVGDDQLAVLRGATPDLELWSARRCVLDGKLAHPDPIESMTHRPGQGLATVAGHAVRLWRDGRVEASFTGYEGELESVVIDGDDVLAITSAPAAVVADVIGAPAPRRVFRGPTKPITDVQLDRKRGQIIAASIDQSLYVWDAATGALVRRLEGTGPLYAVRTSPDGALTIGVGGVSPVVWDPRTGARLGQLEGHSELVRYGELLGDRLFISAAQNHTALVWDVEAARPLLKLLDVDAVKISDDRRAVALIGPGGVRVWSPRMPAPDPGALPVLRK